MQGLIFLCFLSILWITCAQSQAPSYSFPTKYLARVGGWVSDGLTDHQKVISAGWMYVDLTIPSMRVDEVWNLETTFGTDLYDDLNVLSDTHLYFQNSSLFYYANPQGVSCSNSSAGIPPQDWPSSTFVEDVVFEGRLAHQFNQSYGAIPATLYVDVETKLPSGLYFGSISNKPVKFWDGSTVYFRELLEVNSFAASSVLFTAPSFCLEN